MEPLSSFAISIAAGVALEIYPAIKTFRKQGLDKEIKVAFNKALKDWSPNEEIRAQKEHELRSLLHSHIEQRDIITTKVVKQETLDFLQFFEKRLAEHTQAYDYLKAIIDQKRHDEVVIELSTIKEQLSEIHEEIKKGNIDARDVGDWLDKIDFEEGKEKVEAILQNWYSERVIDSELKEVLLLAVKKIFERTDELSQEIEELKLSGDFYLAETLEKIKEAVTQRKPESLTAIYKAYKQKEKEQKIELLQELIASSKAMFAYEEVKQFYRELLQIAPFDKNRSNFLSFLLDFNFHDEATQYSEEILELYRKFSEDDPNKYLPLLALMLNNTAGLHSFKNEALALKEYKEALEIYKSLSKGNSNIYLSKVIMTLNNIGIMYGNKNNTSLSLEAYNEALVISRHVANESPNKSLKDVCMILMNSAKIYRAIGNYSLALKNYKEALEIYRGLAEKNLDTYLSSSMGNLLESLGLLYADMNEYSLAFVNCLESIKIYKNLAKDNSRKYSFFLGIKLRNLAWLYNNQEEYTSAMFWYEEALDIYRKSSKDNPRKYLPYVAWVLSDLVLVYKNLNNFQLAIEKYEESMILYKQLIKEHPQIYDIDYSRALIIGAYLSEKNNRNLSTAKELLLKYPEIPKAQEFLQMINDLEKDTSP